MNIWLAAHLLTLPPTSRVNALAMGPAGGEERRRLAAALKDHGAVSGMMESRRAFAAKREPQYRGWDDPSDHARTPSLESLRADAER